MDKVLEWFDATLAMYLAAAAVWTTLFSLTTKPGVRGLRNLGLLASYITLPAMLFIVPFTKAIATWCAFGLLGGILYILYDILLRLSLSKTEPKHEISLSHLYYGIVAWPIMLPEAIENILAEFRVLPASKGKETAETVKSEVSE